MEGEQTTSQRRQESSVKTPKLPTFCDGKDDLDAYLGRFERYAETHAWDKGTWALNLSALLTGRALEVYSRLSNENAKDYDVLKKALQDRYHLNAEGFRMKLRESVAVEGESPAQFIERLKSYLSKWIELAEVEKSFEGLEYLILSEQFTSTCSANLATFLKERTINSLKELGDVANKFLQAHGKQMKEVSRGNNERKSNGRSENRSQENRKVVCWDCGKEGHRQSECKNKGEKEVPRAGGRNEVKCYNCGKMGHLARNCRSEEQRSYKGGAVETLGEGEVKMAAACVKVARTDREEGEEVMRVDGWVGARREIREAGGCEKPRTAGTTVSDGFINGHKVKTLRDTGCDTVIARTGLVKADQFTGKTMCCALMNGMIVEAPVAKVSVRTPHLCGEVEALCFEEALYDLVIGNVPNAREPYNPDPEWVSEAAAVETRAQAKKKESPLKIPGDQGVEVSAGELAKLQREDAELVKLREMDSVRERGEGKSWFSVQDDVLYRIFVSENFNNGKEVKQVVVPKQLRQQVLAMAHDSLTGGHLGVRRTLDKIQTNFFWPRMRSEVERYCRSCDVCQRTSQKGKVGKVPLERLPIIQTPFKRVGVDIVGPIYPASERGYRYILTMVDHGSRYPEAVPMKNIQAETVAEALVDMFSRVGLPEEILSDLGTQFVAEVMNETCRLLRIRQITTTPYNPKCNGLVERFNGTMKQMLKRLCVEQPKSWDRFINALLFAYREVPQESTGFSPFELLYGRTVRGPMQILRELWTGKQVEEEVKNSYQYVIDLKERLEKTLEIAHENLEQAQTRYKRHYDRRTKVRKLKEGDEVMVLLPTNHNKLLMQWKGPFKVIEVVGKNDYRIQVKGKIRTYHINLLKQYVRRESGKGVDERKKGEEKVDEEKKGEENAETKGEEKGSAENEAESKEKTGSKQIG